MPRKKSNSNYKKVIVKWLDACVWNDGQIPLSKIEEIENPLRETMGYLYKKTKEKVYIIGLYDHEDQMADVITIIPTQWVMEINELK
ncbi:MAG: hypothetical protein PHO87_04580 [Acholeplasmataceae bacterium]|nr:hypothetical protein [Acholeplasmataceae bacterium]